MTVTQFHGMRDRLARDAVTHYVAPTFVRVRDEGEGTATATVRIDQLLERLGAYQRKTWLVVGGPGSGKTSALNRLAVGLLDSGIACVIVTSRVLRGLSSVPTDPREMALDAKPAEVDPPLWKALVKRGHVVFLVDAINELEREFGETATWNFVQKVLQGGHKFPVVATSRRELPQLGAAYLRPIESLTLLPLTEQETDAYLESRGINPQDARVEILAAGLAGTVANPFMLSLLVDWMNNRVEHESVPTPRTRAQLFERTVQRPETEGRLSNFETTVGRSGMTMAAVLTAASLCVFLSKMETEFRRADLTSVLARTWPDPAAVVAIIEAFLDTQMAQPIPDTRPDDDSCQLSHPGFVDFGLALGWRDEAPPAFAFSTEYAEQCLGDWVGLQTEPDRAAIMLLEEADPPPSNAVMVDIVLANRGVLSAETQRRYWAQIGGGLVGDRASRDELASTLARLPLWLLREALRQGLLARVKDDDPALAQSVIKALLTRTLSAQSLQHLRRRHRRAAEVDGKHPTAAPSDIARRITLLTSDPDPTARRKSANWLGTNSDARAVWALMKALKEDGSPVVRGAAATALGNIGSPTALSALSEVLSDRVCEGALRGAAATAIGKIGNAASSGPLCAVLADATDEPAVRGAAATALGKVGHQTNLAPLVSAALDRDADTRVRTSAAYAIGMIGSTAGIDCLIELLVEPNLRKAAATGLGRIGDPRAVAQLAKAMSDSGSDLQARAAAAMALGQIGSHDSIPALAMVVSDAQTPPSPRSNAATALGNIGSRSAIISLATALADRDAEDGVRGAAATALGNIGHPDGVPALTAVLRDRMAPTSVRGAAATALGNIGNPKAVPTLVAEMADRSAHPSVLGAIATALGSIGSTDAAPALMRALADVTGDPASRGAAATALGYIGSPDALPTLREALDDKSNSAAVRGSAASALGNIGSLEAFSTLADALSDPLTDGSVRGSSAAALGRLGDGRAVEPLRALAINSDFDFWSRASAVQAVGHLSTDLDWLHEVADSIPSREPARSPARRLRGAIVNVVSRNPTTPSAIGWLEGIARSDPDPLNRTAAIAGLSASGELRDDLIRYTLFPVEPRPDRRKRDTDNGVCGVAAAAIVRLAEERFEDFELLAPELTSFLTLSSTRGSSINAPIGAIGQLPLETAARTVQVIETLVGSRMDDNKWFKAAFSRLQDTQRRRLRIKSEVELLANAPDSVLRRFADTKTSRFEPMDTSAQVDIALLTAIPIETKMLISVIDELGYRTEQVQRSGRYFDLIEVPGPNGVVRVATTQATDKGGQSAAAATHEIIMTFRPNLVLLVGVCGGLAERGVQQGDVVLARNIFNYDPERLQPDKGGSRPQTYRCDEQVVRLATHLANKGLLDAHLSGGRLHVKDIGSGEKVVAWKESKVRADVMALSTDLYAFETEGHGVMHAIWESFKAEHFVNGSVIKAVSDLGDEEMAVDKARRQEEAARKAALVALEIAASFRRA